MNYHLSNSELTPLEQEAMRLLLEGHDPVLQALRNQYGTSRVSNLELSGAGFLREFEVRANRLPAGVISDFELSDVYADVKGLQRGAVFILFIRDGKLSMLEGSSFSEDWPSEVSSFSVSYINGKRDLSALRARWDPTC